MFISYSRRDYVDDNKQVIPGNIVSKIKDLFDANNISYWFDEACVFSGDAFAPMIARNIKASKIFLFISSEHSNASEWTSNEIATAHAYKKKIIPFRYDDSVYNDSVIIYIARLDYIEYRVNPDKALPRLLASIKSYLKEENDRLEKERQEEERRRNAEISRQERAVKLQNLRERIENLENRKFEIETEILSQEKSLTDLRNEKRIIESNITDLQDEEAMLLGHNRVLNKEQSSKEKTIPTPVGATSKKVGFFKREWQELTRAMRQKHWTVNSVYVLLGFVSMLVVVGMSIAIIDYWHIIYLNVLVCAFAGFVGVYRVLKNCKDSVVWLSVCALFGIIICAKYGADLADIEHLCIVGLWTILPLALVLLLLLIRKNGVRAWSLMKVPAKGALKDKLHVAYITIMALLCLFWSYKYIVAEVEMDYLLSEAESIYSKEILSSSDKARIKDIRDSYWNIGGVEHPTGYYDYDRMEEIYEGIDF